MTRETSSVSSPTFSEGLDGATKRTAHPQTQSPLFAKLPAEVRTLIWTYCVLAHKDLSKPYPVNSRYCRPPDFTHFFVIDTSILQTCRATYNESRHLPASVNTIIIYQSDTSPGRRLGREYDEDDTDLLAVAYFKPDGRPKLRCMTIPKSARVLSLQATRLHIIAEQFWLELWAYHQEAYLPYHINTRHLTITLRRADWRGWCSDGALGIDPGSKWGISAETMHTKWARREAGEASTFEDGSWGQMIGKFVHLVFLELELETVKAQEGELQAIIAQAQKWRFPIDGTSRVLTAIDQQPVWSYWQGPRCLNTYARRDEAEGPELVVAKVFYRASETV